MTKRLPSWRRLIRAIGKDRKRTWECKSRQAKDLHARSLSTASNWVFICCCSINNSIGRDDWSFFYKSNFIFTLELYQIKKSSDEDENDQLGQLSGVRVLINSSEMCNWCESIQTNLSNKENFQEADSRRIPFFVHWSEVWSLLMSRIINLSGISEMDDKKKFQVNYFPASDIAWYWQTIAQTLVEGRKGEGRGLQVTEH